MSNLMQISRLGEEEELQHPEAVATFVTKLWNILAKPEYCHLICWSGNGDTFIVKNETRFAVDVLPHYFKHHNFQSFVRQLNLYGFRKVASHDYGSLSKVKAEDSMVFWHTHFRRSQPGKLNLVQRRVHKGPDGDSEKNPHRLSAVISDIHQMKGRQEGIASILEVLKEDNSHLRHDLVMLKEKHIRQQKILNKIIHFLVQMVYKRKIPSTRRPTRPASNRLMLMESDLLPQSKKLRMATSDPIEELSLDLPSPSIELLGFPPFSVSTDLTSPIDMSGLQQLSPPLLPTPAIGLESPVTSAPSVTSSPSTPADYTVTSPPNAQTTPSQATPATPTTSAQDTPIMTDADLLYPLITETLYPLITETLLETYPIPPTPSNLLSVPHPENQMCIRGQINHQQLGLNNLPQFLSNQLDVDSSMMTEFVLSDEVSDQLPDYNYADTARLLESLIPSDGSEIDLMDPSALINLRAMVPVQGGVEKDPFMYDAPSPVLESSSPGPTVAHAQ